MGHVCGGEGLNTGKSGSQVVEKRKETIKKKNPRNKGEEGRRKAPSSFLSKQQQQERERERERERNV
jgi:hypothetical protein